MIFVRQNELTLVQLVGLKMIYIRQSDTKPTALEVIRHLVQLISK